MRTLTVVLNVAPFLATIVTFPASDEVASAVSWKLLATRPPRNCAKQMVPALIKLLLYSKMPFVNCAYTLYTAAMFACVMILAPFSCT